MELIYFDIFILVNLFSEFLLFRHSIIYLDTMAQKIENAIAAVIKQQRIKTRDIGGYATQQDFLRSILHQLEY